MNGIEIVGEGSGAGGAGEVGEKEEEKRQKAGGVEIVVMRGLDEGHFLFFGFIQTAQSFF